jgi:hypothetical protein
VPPRESSRERILAVLERLGLCAVAREREENAA